MEIKEGIPEEVQLMAEAFIRTCAKHNVCLTGFMFRESSETQRPFIQQIGTISDTGERMMELHQTLFDFIQRAGVQRTVLKKNDA